MSEKFKKILGRFDFPMILAQLTFFPMGIPMGYILYVFNTNWSTRNGFIDVKFWPFIIAASAALLTAVLMKFTQKNYKRFLFEHFYWMAVGMVLMFIGHHGRAAIHYQFWGMGICYVAALSYVNLRAAKNRFFNISICHAIYLFAVALSSDLFTKNLNRGFDAVNSNRNISKMSAIVSIILILLYLVNEICHHKIDSYNYKKSLDDNFNRENNNGEIFMAKYFEVPAESREEKWFSQSTFAIFGLATKILNVMYFYYPFYVINKNLQTFWSGYSRLCVSHWCGFIGILLSLGAICKFKYRPTFIVSCVLKIFILVLISTMAYVKHQSHDGPMRIILYFFFMIIAFGYSFPDVNILSLTTIKSQELAIATGYAVEMMLIGAYFYNGMRRDDTDEMYHHQLVSWLVRAAIGFGVILIVSIVLGLKVLPRGLSDSLLSRNNFLTKAVITPTQEETPVETLSKKELEAMNGLQEYYPSEVKIDNPPAYDTISHNADLVGGPVNGNLGVNHQM